MTRQLQREEKQREEEQLLGTPRHATPRLPSAAPPCFRQPTQPTQPTHPP